MFICVLRQIRTFCHRLTTDESGPTAVEYAILLAVLILGSVGIISSIGASFANLYAIISAALPAGFA